MDNPKHTSRVSTLFLEKGEVVTVWLDGQQVELRVLRDGRREIFVTKDSVRLYDFGLWTSGQ